MCDLLAGGWVGRHGVRVACLRAPGPGNVGWQPERVDQHSQVLSPGPEESGAGRGGAASHGLV